jgi:hypothetical protein
MDHISCAHEPETKSKRMNRAFVCGDNEEAPIGFSVIKDILANMDVFHQ